MDRIKKFGRNTFSSLSIRNYRLYFAGQAISLTGTWMQSIAQGWLVLQITGSGTQLGLVFALQFLPLLFFGPWGGLVADRYNKRSILYYTNALSALLSLCLSLSVLSGTTQLWHLYLFALAMGIVRVFDNPVRQTFVTEMVGSEHVKNAVSLNSTVNNLARVIGPSLSGILVASVGIAFCFLVNALSFVGAIVTLVYMRSEDLHAAAIKKALPHELRNGFHYIARTPLIRDTLIMMTLVGTFVFEFQVSLPILAQQTFASDAAGYALLMSTMGLGSVLGGLYAAGRTTIAPENLLWFSLLTSISLFCASLMPTLLLAAVAMGVVGFFTINVTSLANTMIQLESSPSMRGRVMAFWSMAMMGSTPLGGPVVGFVGEHVGGRWGIAIGGIAALVAAVYGSLTLLQQDRKEKVSKKVLAGVESAMVEHIKRV